MFLGKTRSSQIYNSRRCTVRTFQREVHHLPLGLMCVVFRRVHSEPWDANSDVEVLLAAETPGYTRCNDCSCAEPELLMLCCDCDLIICQLCREEEHVSHCFDVASNTNFSGHAAPCSIGCYSSQRRSFNCSWNAAGLQLMPIASLCKNS